MSEFQIRKDNFLINRIVDAHSAPHAIADGEVLLKIDRFAFTANNITYAVLGDKLGYWQFFPPADNADGHWGMIPVWGFADVVASKADAVPVGERLFTVIVDMSGNAQLLAQLHRHLGVNMKRCIQVGLTHWERDAQSLDGFISERSAVFFAPGHIQKRMQEWGSDVFASKSGVFMQGSIRKSQSLFKFTELDGLDGLAKVYVDVCQGSIAPNQALVVRL